MILRRRGGILFVVTSGCTLIEQILTSKIEIELGSMDGASLWLWIYGGLSVVLSLVQPSVLILVCISSLRTTDDQTSYFTELSCLVKESLRATGAAIWWGFLLIIPGLIRFLQFSFVPFVVFLDPEYRAGKKDALKESTRRVNQRFVQVLGILVLFTVLIPLGLSSLDEWSLLLRHPLSGLALCALDVAVSLFSFLLLFQQWEKSNGSDVQLATN
jgi:hypothetical protein